MAFLAGSFDFESYSYGRTKLGNILFARQLVKRHLSGLPNPIIATSVHPGTVDTEVQQAWTESYGSIFGKALEQLTKLVGKSAPEGAEASLWAATSEDIFADNWKDYQVLSSVFLGGVTFVHIFRDQGNYYSEPYGTPGQESAQAKDEHLGDNFWSLCATLAKEILGEDVS